MGDKNTTNNCGHKRDKKNTANHKVKQKHKGKR